MNHPDTKPAPRNFARNLVQPSAHERGSDFVKGDYGKRNRLRPRAEEFETEFPYGEKDNSEIESEKG